MFYWSNRVLMQRLATLNATVGHPECNGWPHLLCRLAYRFGRRRRHDEHASWFTPGAPSSG